MQTTLYLIFVSDPVASIKIVKFPLVPGASLVASVSLLLLIGSKVIFWSFSFLSLTVKL